MSAINQEQTNKEFSLLMYLGAIVPTITARTTLYLLYMVKYEAELFKCYLILDLITRDLM